VNSDCSKLRRLILVEEDLEPQERDGVREHLQRCAACRALRDRLLAAESVARSVESLPETDAPLASLSEVERAQARASLAALLAAQGARPLPFWRRPLPLALAAVAALAIVWPVLREDSPVRDLRVGSPLVLRGDDPAAAAAPHGVSFRLAEPGYPVLIHIDGAGEVRVIHPAGGDPAVRLPEGRLVLLPPVASTAWREGLAPGPETYLLAVAAESPPPATLLQPLSAPAAGSRRDAIRAAAARLERAVGPVSRCDGPGGN
jgi:hypothetical protein